MKKLLILLFIAVIGLTAQSYGQNNCRNAVSLQNNSNITTPLNTDVFWCNVVPENDSMIYIFSTNNNTAALIATIKLYKGGCDSLELINTYTVNDSTFFIEFFNLQPNNNYFFKVNFNNTLNGNFIMYSIIVPDSMPCPNPSSCSLVKNYSFEYIRDSIDASLAFQSNQVCYWERAWGSPSWSGIGYLNDGAPYMWSAENRTEAIFQGGMTLQPNVEYTITYDYLASTTDFSSINVGLSNFSLPSTIIGDAAPLPPGFTMYPIGTINLLTSSYSANTWYHYNSNLNLSFTPNSAYNNLVIYPLRPGINSPYVLVDNIVIKPKLIFQNLQSPQTIGCNSITMQPLVPTISNIDSWEWTSNQSGSAILATTQNFQVSPSVNTIYTVTAYTHTATGEIECQWTGSFTVNVNAIHPIVNAGNDATICLGNNITIGGNPTASGAPAPFTYYWTISNVSYVSNLPNPVVSPTISITYTVIATSSNGCSGTDNVTIIVNSVPAAVPVIIGNHNNCDLTTTYTIETPGANSVYTWAFTPTNPGATGNISGQGTPTITVDWNDPSGSNMNMGKLTVTNTENGCTSTSSINIYRCCRDIEYPENTLNDETINNNNIVSGQRYYLNGVITVDNQNLELNYNQFFMGPYAKIIVKEPYKLTITAPVNNVAPYLSILQSGCDFMWDGIYVSDPTAEVDVIGNSTVRDAINGIVSENGGKFTLRDANMDNNLYSVRVHNYTDQTPHTGTIRNTRFNGGSPLLPPYNVNNGHQKTLCGVECNIVSDFTIGDETDAANLNTFQNMRFGVYATNSNLTIVNNKFLNIINGTYTSGQMQKNYPEGAIYAQYSESTTNPYNNITVGGESLKRNYFDNCKTGIYSYQYLNTIENNEIKNTGIGIQSLNIYSKSKYKHNIIYDNLGNGVSAGYGIDIRNTHSNMLQRGIACLVDSNDVINKRIGISLLGISGTQRNDRLVEVKHNIINYTLNVSPLNHHYVPTPSTAKHIGIWIQNSHYSQTMLNTIIRNYPVLASSGEDSTVLGIKIGESREAYVFQNLVERMGSGIYTNGTLTNTKFNCNTLTYNNHGFQFGFASSVSDQGIPNPNTGNYNPQNYWYEYNVGAGTERMFAHPFYIVGNFRYYYNPNSGWSYDPTVGGIGSNQIIPHLNPNAPSLCIAQTDPLGHVTEDPQVKIEAREVAYGQIVRNERFYAYLEDEYKQKDREYVYEMLRSYPELINLGGEDDNLYLQFYNECFQSDIEKVLKVREAMYAQNLEYAREKLAQIADDNTINTNRKIVDGIYLDTWAQDNFELNDEQVSTLRRIALLTPYAGGDAVYTARVMLNIDPDEIAGLDYARPPVHYSMQTKEINAFVFPNPAKDKITVKFTETIATDGSIEFYGMMGNLVYTTTITKGVAEMQINVNSLKSGLYFYTVKVNDTKITSGKITIVNK